MLIGILRGGGVSRQLGGGLDLAECMERFRFQIVSI